LLSDPGNALRVIDTPLRLRGRLGRVSSGEVRRAGEHADADGRLVVRPEGLLEICQCPHDRRQGVPAPVSPDAGVPVADESTRRVDVSGALQSADLDGVLLQQRERFLGLPRVLVGGGQAAASLEQREVTGTLCSQAIAEVALLERDRVGAAPGVAVGLGKLVARGERVRVSRPEHTFPAGQFALLVADRTVTRIRRLLTADLVTAEARKALAQPLHC
jgi:hypothetical protein